MTSTDGAKTSVPRHKSNSVSEVSDPRAEKTRTSISGAFVHLLLRRPYARIRVSDVTRRAGVGRATFYAHFESKDSLLSTELTRVANLGITPLPDDPCLVDCTALFAHLQHVPEIYHSLMAVESRVIAEYIIQEALEKRVAQIMTQSTARESTTAPAFVPRFVAATMLALIAWSLEQLKAPPPADLQALYRCLVGGALRVAGE